MHDCIFNFSAESNNKEGKFEKAKQTIILSNYAININKNVEISIFKQIKKNPFNCIHFECYY